MGRLRFYFGRFDNDGVLIQDSRFANVGFVEGGISSVRKHMKEEGENLKRVLESD